MLDVWGLKIWALEDRFLLCNGINSKKFLRLAFLTPLLDIRIGMNKPKFFWLLITFRN